MVGNPWPALAILVLVRTGMGLQFQSVAAVGPALVAEFRLDYAALGSLVGAYLLPGVAVALPGGWLGARLGDLRLVRAGLALMALGGAASALAHGFPLLLAGRLAAGAGAALLNVFLAKMTTDLFAGRSLVVAMGWLLSAWPAGIGLALLTLGWVGAALSWRAALGATAAVALLGLALMAAYPTPRTEVGQKTSGASRLPPAVLAAVLAVGAMWALLNAAQNASSVGIPPAWCPGKSWHSVPSRPCTPADNSS